MFAAAAAADAVRRHRVGAEDDPSAAAGCDVVIFEGTSKTMSKVRLVFVSSGSPRRAPTSWARQESENACSG